MESVKFLALQFDRNVSGYNVSQVKMATDIPSPKIFVENVPAIKAGDIVMRSEPWIYCLHPKLFPKYCYRCLLPFFPVQQDTSSGSQSPTSKIIDCNGCGLARYCSLECQMDDKKTRHGEECTLLRAMRATGIQPEQDELLVLKAILKIKKGVLNDLEGACQPPTNRGFQDLISHEEHIINDPQRMGFVTELQRKLGVILWEGDMLELQKLVEIYGKIKINSFDLRDDYLRRIGEGVYFGPCMFGHSCKKNATYRFEGREVIVQAIEDISDMKQVHLSYTNIFTFRALRQNELKDWHYFDCSCDLCVEPTIEAELQAILCLNQDCDAPRPLDIRAQQECTSCMVKGNGLLPESEEDLSTRQGNLEENQRRLELAKRLVGLDFKQHQKIDILREKYLESARKSEPGSQAYLEEIEWRCQRILDTAGLLYHPQNYILGVTLDTLGRVLLTQRKKDIHPQALEYLRGAIPSMRKIFGPYDPRLGMQILTVSLLELEQLTEKPGDDSALTHANEAVTIFRICNGNDRPLCQTAARVASRAQVLLNNNLEDLPGSEIENMHVMVDEVLPVLTDVLYSSLYPRPLLN